MTKIRYNPDEYTIRREEKANKGCNICPICGETRRSTTTIRIPGCPKGETTIKTKGIIRHPMIPSRYSKKLNKHYVYDRYECPCGAIWRSEEYLI